MNNIHPSVIQSSYGDDTYWHTMGDNNYIAEDVRILCKEFHMGDNCKIHNNVFIDGLSVRLGNNVWIGQYSHIDGYEGVIIGDDVTIGYNCYIWTHAGRSGVDYRGKYDSVIIRRGAWLMGANVVINPGVIIAEDCRILSNSVVTKNTRVGKTYGGVPAKEIA